MRQAKLTEQQETFVTHFTSTPGAIANGSEAARLAGYSDKALGEIAYQLLQKPHVRKAIEDANRQLISGSLATKAVHLLERVIDDESAPLKVRVEAAKTVLDRAGIVPPSTAERADAHKRSDKPFSEMSIEELEIFVARGTIRLTRGQASEVEQGPLLEAQPLLVQEH